MGENAISVTGDLPSHMGTGAGGDDVAEVYVSNRDKTYKIKSGQTNLFPLHLDMFLRVKRLGRAPVRITNLMKGSKVMLEETTKPKEVGDPGDVLDAVIDPKQTYFVEGIGSSVQVTL